MNMYAFAVLVATVLIAADGPSNPAKDEHMKLNGTWVIESVTRDPREQKPDEGKGIRCVIKDEKVVVKLPGEAISSGELVIKIDPTRNPKTMDLSPNGEKETVRAVYELAGDTLRVCWGSDNGKERPAEFASTPGSGHTLVVLKREKP